MSKSIFTITQIQVKQNELSSTKLKSFKLDAAELREGEILLEIESFGFSANNITYAALGHTMGYWGFFPADEGFGIIPVWGFAKVAYSNHPDISVGEKVFGYLPMATHLVARPHKANEYGFSDSHPARKSISPVYDNYLYCKNDPGYNPKREAWQLNFRPLFMTSFVLDQFVEQHVAHQSLILTSASSKTAFGTAFLLKAFRSYRAQDYEVIGLTSTANKSLVQSLGCYDKVYCYEDIESMPSNTAWLLDFAANGQVIEALTSRFGDDLNKITLIGATDWAAEEKPNKKALEAEIFFAPSLVKSLNQEWGQGVFLTKYAEAWKNVAKSLEGSMKEQRVCGTKQILELYVQTLEGRADTTTLNTVKFV